MKLYLILTLSRKRYVKTIPKREDRWQVIPYEEIENISLSELIDKTIEHMKNNVKLYDQLVELDEGQSSVSHLKVSIHLFAWIGVSK